VKVGLLVPGGVDRTGTHRVIPCLLWLIERLVAAGDEVHVFSHSQEPGPGEWTLLGARVRNTGRRAGKRRMLAGVVREHRRGRFHVLHAFWPAPAGVVAGAAGKLLRVPVLLHLPGGDLTRLPEIGYGGRTSWRNRTRLRLALAGASRIVAPSTFIVQQGRALGIDVERLPFGVALDRWPVRPPRRRQPGAAARLLHVGSLNRVKDQGTLLRAAARLRDRGIPFTLDVIGEDTLGGAVQRLAAELELGDAVRFHGYLPHGELRPWVESADLLLVTSRHEAGPLVLLEAAVAGVPTVGTAVGHLLDWAPHACAVVPVGDHAALAAQVERLLGDEDARLAMAAAAQTLSVAEDADFTAARVRAIYAELIGAR
jgi:glycosyltransferase involved in cell wall biosynthesis